MNAFTEIKSKAIAFEAKHKVIPKTIAAVSALELMAVNASAETGSCDLYFGRCIHDIKRIS